MIKDLEGTTEEQAKQTSDAFEEVVADLATQGETIISNQQELANMHMYVDTLRELVLESVQAHRGRALRILRTHDAAVGAAVYRSRPSPLSQRRGMPSHVPALSPLHSSGSRLPHTCGPQACTAFYRDSTRFT